MPVPLSPTPAGSITTDGYTDALTLGPSTQLKTIQFTVASNTVLAQIWRVNKNKKAILDQTEIPFAPGQWGLDDVCGIRFRSAFSGFPATVNVVGYFGDDAVPFGNASVAPSSSSSIWSGGYQVETVSRHSAGMTSEGFYLAPEGYQIVGIDEALQAGQKITGAIVFLQQTPTGALPTHHKLILVDELTLTVKAAVEIGALLEATTPGFLKIPFGSPFIVPIDGNYYVGDCCTGAYGGTAPAIYGTSDTLTGPTEVSRGVFSRPDAMLGFGAGLGNAQVGTILPAGNANATRFWIALY